MPVDIVSSGPKITAKERNDFNSSPKKVSLRQDILLGGTTGVGKTSFGLRYMPDPISILYFDGRADAAIEECRDLGKIIHDLPIDPVDPDLEDNWHEIAKDKAAQVKGNIIHASKTSKTIILDGLVELANIINFAYNNLLPSERKGPNATFGKDADFVYNYFRTIYRIFKSGNAHSLVITRDKEVWEDQRPTGNIQNKGPKVIDNLVTWSAILYRQTEVGVFTKKDDDEESKIRVRVLKAGRNWALEGKEFSSKDWGIFNPFVHISTLMNKDFGAKEEDFL